MAFLVGVRRNAGGPNFEVAENSGGAVELLGRCDGGKDVICALVGCGSKLAANDG